MPTDAQRRNLASAHHALVAQHEATIIWQAAEISKHLEKIALLEQQLAEAKHQMESQKDEWLSWEAKRAAIELDAKRYQWLAWYLPSDEEGFDDAIVAASSKNELDSVIDDAISQYDGASSDFLNVPHRDIKEQT